MTDWPLWRRRLQQIGERRLLILSGSEAWAMAQAVFLCGENRLWVGQAPLGHETQAAGKIQRYLGREYDTLVYNAYSGLHPDAFGALLGTVTAGGLVLLLCPPLADWPGYADPDLARYVALPEQAAGLESRFIRRFVSLLRQDPQVLLWQQGSPPPALPALPDTPWLRRRDRRGCLNQEQRQALARILRAARRRQPLVLTADRGRGKSSLLGLAAARLLDAGYRVLLTAPSPAAAARALEHSSQRLPFIAPDALLAQHPPTDLLLVDEAAAIPAPMLLNLARRYCCIFASTEHGYEGTGLGFQLKFQPALARLAPNWQKYHLDTPARWSPRDPLEPLVFRLLALDADPPAPPVGGALSFRYVCRQQLEDHDILLQQVFGLLTLAHYQTRPSDLRQLLDAPGLELALACRDHTPVAAALLVREGKLDPALGQAVWCGQRRPRGHLLPQSLAFHGGFKTAGDFSYRRIMRIVVHPHCQQQGIGSRLLSWLKQRGGADFLGTSFGASPELLRFWQHNDFRAVRVGLVADAVSGLHAAMMLWPCSRPAHRTLPAWRGQFSANLSYYREGLLQALPETWWQSLHLCPPLPMPALDTAIARGFAFAHRDLMADQAVLARFALAATPFTPLDRKHRALLHALLSPGATPVAVAPEYGLSGQKAAVRQLRTIIQHFFPCPHPPSPILDC
ncbi:tRNA(Met) cytidine acetyltransferase TmcA [Zobellella sp. DQSA1]|uniref:tRNA(Met) cytidine acetyltransferase TmcA n=1 Tax=Zobellella sp. DQSA1 TaxID=3342386 RepID=UPI0035C0DB33